VHHYEYSTINSHHSGLFIGLLAEQYLRQFASQPEVDKTFGIYDNGGKFYIGDSPIEINDDNTTAKGTECQRTPRFGSS